MCEHLALKGRPDVLPTSPPPSPPSMSCHYIELPVENNKPPNLNAGEGEGVWIVLSSQVTLFRTMSQQFCC